MDDCSICYDSITALTGNCTLGCAHTFHLACISRWAQTTASCPLCRKELGETERLPKPITEYFPVRQNTDLGHSYLSEIDVPVRHNTDVGHRYLSDYLRSPMWVTLPARIGRTSILDNLNDLLHMTEVSIRIGNGITVSEADIRLVMERSNVSRSLAVRTLRENDGNVSESIYELAHIPPVNEEDEPVPPRNLLEPTDDMLTTWALERLFSKGSILENDDVERVEDIRYRTSEVFRYGCWMSPEYKDIPKRRRADSF